MKMGATLSPCPYDVPACHALQSAKPRPRAILHYASWAAASSVWLPFDSGHAGHSRDRRDAPQADLHVRRSRVRRCPGTWQLATSLGLARPKGPPLGYFARRKSTVVVEPPPDGLGTVKVNSSSPLNDSNRFCVVPSKFGKVLPFIVIVISWVASSIT